MIPNVCLEFQAEKCLRLEKDGVSLYLHSSSEEKLLEVCTFIYKKSNLAFLVK